MTDPLGFDRRSGIGGSDAGKIAGVSKFGTAHDVWMEKMGLSAPLLETEAMEWGNLLEAPVLAKYSRETGYPIVVLRESDGSQRTMWHPKYPWMYTHLDARTRRKPFRIVEAKTTNPFALEDWGEPGTDQVPPEYHLQAQHEMAVTGWDVVDMPVLIGGQRFRRYTIPRDDELISTLIEVESDLWDHVQSGTPPAVDGSEGAGRLLATRYPTDDGTELEANEAQAELVRRYLLARTTQTAVEEQVEYLAQQIKDGMGTASVLSGQTFRATWKYVAGLVSWKAVAESLAPADSAAWQKIVAASRSAGTRRFIVNEKAGT